MIGTACFLKHNMSIIFMPRTFTDGTGLTVRFYREDRPLLENGGEVKINLQDYPDKTLEIYVVDKISDKVKRIKISGDQVEPGIRTMNFPSNASPEEVKVYRIWMEKKIARKLIYEREGPMKDGGIDTRCWYGRLCMTYYDM